MIDVDLIVIGAGLSGCALVFRLRQLGWKGQIAVVEAGRLGYERPAILSGFLASSSCSGPL